MQVLWKMNSLVEHRGPDDEGATTFSGDQLEARALAGRGTKVAPNPSVPYLALTSGGPSQDIRVALGHRRLSIIDLSDAGHGPMSTGDGLLWITYNGEVYNFEAVRKELERAGHRFVSATDTEVILAAYREWGPDCLRRLHGMFAFVLLDRERRRLFCARDRFGIKPLYYCVLPDGLIAFTSEIKQFTALPGFTAEMNKARAYDYLAWAVTDHTDETLFHGVYQLRPGESLELAIDAAGRRPPGGRLHSTRWYQLKAKPFAGTFEQASSAFRERFTSAVSEHLRSDVPVGSCLSGGLDSSSVVCTMSRLLGGAARQMTFSSRSEDDRLDEGPYIEEAVRAAGVEGHDVWPTADALFSSLDELVRQQDEPFGSSSVFAQSEVFALAKRHGATVMLDGQGADEQLAGYRTFLGPSYADLFRHGRALDLLRSMAGARSLQRLSYLWSAQSLADTLLPEQLRQSARRMFGHASSEPDWLDIGRLDVEACDPYAPRARSVNDLSLAQLTRTNLQMLLRWEDRSSMLHSVEARVPFLDHTLVEFTLGLPTEYKLSAGLTKRVLRRAMEGMVPAPILARTDKIGFATPEEMWAKANAGWFREEVAAAVESARGVLRPSAVTLTDAVLDGRHPFDFTVWRMLCFGRWLRAFQVAIR
jgi:asparagine synthase (glutamine-hydrolysing)